MDSLDADIVGLLSRRAYDIAGSMASAKGKPLKVTLNGEKLPIKSFKDYIDLYDGIATPAAFQKVRMSKMREALPFRRKSFSFSLCSPHFARHPSSHLCIPLQLSKLAARTNLLSPSLSLWS